MRRGAWGAPPATGHHGAVKPVGTITRGTTNPNRLRRVDRYLAGPLAPVLRAAGPRPVVVDLGYGAHPWTVVELHERLRRVRPDVRVLGIEIDPDRVAAALPFATPDRAFVPGGFELPRPAGWPPPTLVRAFNVLRQYDADEVAGAWAPTDRRAGPGGLVVEGTCDEIGRRAAWLTLDEAGPRSFTISVRLASLTRPSDVADRLPKALIHRNVPGEPIHAWLQALDRAWELATPLRVHGPRQRWLATVASLRSSGRPVRDAPTRWRLGELTVPWSVVAPRP
ncbi:MAG: class I SAM-dependent methyltransferase [Micropruina sp.]|nr:MAG: class I SAM-dependent methyltransferase [Micropruina sp.]